ncbi:MAG: sigma-70 family RNA polymerase sigma factor [Oligoflexia bacterium]|nr:sigma-70 family RNA polymerase sigma factor [Oligoflexia bacterium]
MNLSDEELMMKYQMGTYEAFQELYRRHSGMIYGFIKKRVKNEAMASDIFQEVFMKLHRSKNLYKKQLPFKPWLFTITQNALVDEIRKTKKKEYSDIDLDTLEAANSTSSEFNNLVPVLSELSSTQKIAIEMRYIEDKTFEEIAATLNTSEANVRQIISRAVRNLKDLIGKGKSL